MEEYKLANLEILIPLDPRNCEHFPDPGMPSLAKGEDFFFPIFCQINSYIALSGATFVVP